MAYTPLSDILVSDEIAVLNLYNEFYALTESQKLIIFNTVQQQICNSYCGNGKINYDSNSLYGASIIKLPLTTADIPDSVNRRYIIDNERDALEGTSGTEPSDSNKFVDNADLRLEGTILDPNYLIFPTYQHGTSAIILPNNAYLVAAYAFHVQNKFQFSKIILTADPSYPGAGSWVIIGLYTFDGNTKLFSTGWQSVIPRSVIRSSLSTPYSGFDYTIEPGVYRLVISVLPLNGLRFSGVSFTYSLVSFAENTNFMLWGETVLTKQCYAYPEATAKAITNIVDNGSGLPRVTAIGHGRSTNDWCVVGGVLGTTEVNGSASKPSVKVTKINNDTLDLVGISFVHTYISGGSICLESSMLQGFDGLPATLGTLGLITANYGSIPSIMFIK
jgi:hypothetical protein